MEKKQERELGDALGHLIEAAVLFKPFNGDQWKGGIDNMLLGLEEADLALGILHITGAQQLVKVAHAAFTGAYATELLTRHYLLDEAIKLLREAQGWVLNSDD